MRAFVVEFFFGLAVLVPVGHKPNSGDRRHDASIRSELPRRNEFFCFLFFVFFFSLLFGPLFFSSLLIGPLFFSSLLIRRRFALCSTSVLIQRQ